LRGLGILLYWAADRSAPLPALVFCAAAVLLARGRLGWRHCAPVGAGAGGVNRIPSLYKRTEHYNNLSVAVTAQECKP